MKVSNLGAIAIAFILTNSIFGVKSAPNKTEQQDVYKILVLIPFASKSHVIAFIPLLKALSQKGHQLTYVSLLQMTSDIPGTEEIVLKEINDEYEKRRPNNFKIDMFSSEVAYNMTSIIETSCEIIFQNDKIKNILKRKFDLAIVDSLMGECTFPIIHKLQVPFISLCTTSLYTWVSWAMNVPSPVSYVPQSMTTYSQVMNFQERLFNLVAHSMYLFYRNYYFVSIAEKHIYKYFPDFPGVHQFEKNASLLLTNSHPTLDYIRPSMPFVIEVGGMHCKPGSPLPKVTYLIDESCKITGECKCENSRSECEMLNLEDFIDGAGAAGFIYFSMGSNVRGTDMPQEMQKMFIEAFSKLQQRVIWKFEAQMDDVPSNILITKWAPQQDLLAHPAVKLFITHAGQLSTQEAVYHSVPVIGMPMFADQMGNIANLAAKGIGESLDHHNLNTDIIYNTIRKIIDNKSYKENAEKYSKLFKDRPQDLVETAVYWVEYVIHHKGAHHLKTPADHLNFFQYFLVDIIAFIAIVVIIIVLILFCAFRFVFRKIRGCYKSKSKND